MCLLHLLSTLPNLTFYFTLLFAQATITDVSGEVTTTFENARKKISCNRPPPDFCHLSTDGKELFPLNQFKDYRENEIKLTRIENRRAAHHDK